MPAMLCPQDCGLIRRRVLRNSISWPDTLAKYLPVVHSVKHAVIRVRSTLLADDEWLRTPPLLPATLALVGPLAGAAEGGALETLPSIGRRVAFLVRARLCWRRSNSSSE